MLGLKHAEHAVMGSTASLPREVKALAQMRQAIDGATEILLKFRETH